MRKEIADRWVTELRSGKYVQGTGVLVDTTDPNGPKHCCLGVLMEMASREGLCYRSADADDYVCFIDSETGFATGAVLSDRVMNWAGMWRPNGGIGSSFALSEENDKGVTFSEIADIIENRWMEL